ncbi:MAG TPA: hypothetical protein VKM94_04865 [Blastocatellia bacterium]|nr:hypothetical protein [Blastocatellia bacterium]
MLKHRSAERLPQVTFTSDFHELVQGDLIPGPCSVRYDPWRIVPSDEIQEFAAAQRSVRAHIRFHPTGTLWEDELRCRPGTRIDPEPDPTGRGTMLGGECYIPDNADELECWFSYSDRTGQMRWDSEMGANFWLRFPAHDLRIVRAETVEAPSSAVDNLEVEIESVPEVETLLLRWRLTSMPFEPRRQANLICSGTRGDKSIWSAPGVGIHVPSGATAVFDLVYAIRGREFTDDNEGTWFLAESARASTGGE